MELTHTTAPVDDSVVIRRATPTDDAALMRLAVLDSAPLPSGDVLIAEVGGEAQAAIEVASDTVIADPLRPTTHLVDLLRIRAARLRETTEAPRWARAVHLGPSRSSSS